MKEFLLETYKIVLAMVLVATIGVILEHRVSESAREREKELLLLDRAVDHYEDFGAALASIRALIYRMSDDRAGSNTNELYEEAYGRFTQSKLPFVLNLQRANVGDQKDHDAFNKLNVLVVEMDSCISIKFSMPDLDSDCDLSALYTKFLNDSASFEENIYSKLLRGN